jgi:hypothetical protein
MDDKPILTLTFKALITAKALRAAYVQGVLSYTNGNKTEAARILGITRRSLYDLILHGEVKTPKGETIFTRKGKFDGSPSTIECARKSGKMKSIEQMRELGRKSGEARRRKKAERDKINS